MKILSDNFTQIINSKKRQYFGLSENNVHKGNFSTELYFIMLRKRQETQQISSKYEHLGSSTFLNNSLSQ